MLDSMLFLRLVRVCESSLLPEFIESQTVEVNPYPWQSINIV